MCKYVYVCLLAYMSVNVYVYKSLGYTQKKILKMYTKKKKNKIF